MEENEVMKSLFDECLAYVIYGQNMHPVHVKDILKKAFEAGYKQGKEDSPKVRLMGELPLSPIDFD